MTDLMTSKASGREIHKVVDKIWKVTKDVQEDHVLMACLAVAILTQVDEITPKELEEGVLAASEWVAMYVSGIGKKVVVN